MHLVNLLMSSLPKHRRRHCHNEGRWTSCGFAVRRGETCFYTACLASEAFSVHITYPTNELRKFQCHSIRTGYHGVVARRRGAEHSRHSNRFRFAMQDSG